MPLGSIKDLIARLGQLTEADYYLRYMIPPEPGYMVHAGEPGKGKTNLNLNMAACIATGKPDFLAVPTKQTRVAYIMFEGGSNLVDRFHKLEGQYGSGLDNNLDIDIWAPENLKALEVKLIKAFKGYGIGILDPLNRIFWGNPNNTVDMMENVRLIEKISRESGAFLVVNHHTRKRNNDPRYKFQPKDLEDIKGANELISGSLTAMMLCDEYQSDQFEFRGSSSSAFGRGAPPLRGPDFMVLHVMRAQASPEGSFKMGIHFIRDKLLFERSEGLISMNAPLLTNGSHP